MSFVSGLSKWHISQGTFQRFLKIVETITPGFENFDSTGTACFERWKVIKIVCKGDLNSEGQAGKKKKESESKNIVPGAWLWKTTFCIDHDKTLGSRSPRAKRDSSRPYNTHPSGLLCDDASRINFNYSYQFHVA